MPTYRISGLLVGSAFVLPGALPVAVPDGRAGGEGEDGGGVDVTLRCRTLPDSLSRPRVRTAFWQVEGDRFLLTLPGIGRFLAVGGRAIDLDPAPGTTLADALPFLLGTGIGAILYQRGALVLHAATVAWQGRAYTFCGPSGVGKSTLAASLCDAGCRLVADDVSAVVTGADGAPAIASDGRLLKLFARTIERLGLQERTGEPVRAGTGKHYVAPASDCAGLAVPLAGAYRLRRSPPGVPLRTTRLSPLVAAQVLQENAYRRRLALAYAADGRAMALTAALVRRVPVSVLAQPEDFAALPGTVAALLAGWDEAGS